MKTFEKYFGTISNVKDADDKLLTLTPEEKKTINNELSKFIEEASEGNTNPIYIYVLEETSKTGGSRRRRRPSRKYKKSAKRVFRKKSRSTRRR